MASGYFRTLRTMQHHTLAHRWNMRPYINGLILYNYAIGTRHNSRVLVNDVDIPKNCKIFRFLVKERGIWKPFKRLSCYYCHFKSEIESFENAGLDKMCRKLCVTLTPLLGRNLTAKIIYIIPINSNTAKYQIIMKNHSNA